MTLTLLAHLLIGAALAADPNPTAEPSISPSGVVLDALGALIWRPGLPTIRHANGVVAWSENSRVCFDASGRRVAMAPCRVVLDGEFTLLVQRSEGAPTSSVVLEAVHPSVPASIPEPKRSKSDTAVAAQ